MNLGLLVKKLGLSGPERDSPRLICFVVLIVANKLGLSPNKLTGNNGSAICDRRSRFRPYCFSIRYYSLSNWEPPAMKCHNRSGSGKMQQPVRWRASPPSPPCTLLISSVRDFKVVLFFFHLSFLSLRLCIS